MNDNIMRMPDGMMRSSNSPNILQLDGLTVLEICNSLNKTFRGRLYLEDHLLLFVLSGKYTVIYGNQHITLRNNQMVLLKKSIVVEYEKSAEPQGNEPLDYWMFFIKDDLLLDFAKKSNIKPPASSQSSPIIVQSANDRLLTYLESLRPYFTDKETINNDLLKLKFFELLYNLEAKEGNLIQQMLQFRPASKGNIASIMEEHMFNPVTLADLAYLSGRSLSSFKRDFYAIYQVAPSQWIREHRINKAKELLTSTSLPITDICFITGFESPAHFSRIFKDVTGCSPSSYRQKNNFQ